jgi:hypothetical protein
MAAFYVTRSSGQGNKAIEAKEALFRAVNLIEGVADMMEEMDDAQLVQAYGFSGSGTALRTVFVSLRNSLAASDDVDALLGQLYYLNEAPQ